MGSACSRSGFGGGESSAVYFSSIDLETQQRFLSWHLLPVLVESKFRICWLMILLHANTHSRPGSHWPQRTNRLLGGRSMPQSQGACGYSSKCIHSRNDRDSRRRQKKPISSTQQLQYTRILDAVQDVEVILGPWRPQCPLLLVLPTPVRGGAPGHHEHYRLRDQLQGATSNPMVRRHFQLPQCWGTAAVR